MALNTAPKISRTAGQTSSFTAAVSTVARRPCPSVASVPSTLERTCELGIGHGQHHLGHAGEETVEEAIHRTRGVVGPTKGLGRHVVDHLLQLSRG